nr:hypothetical protein Q903MT_gene1054 [Picea sitchensis]
MDASLISLSSYALSLGFSKNQREYLFREKEGHLSLREYTMLEKDSHNALRTNSWHDGRNKRL